MKKKRIGEVKLWEKTLPDLAGFKDAGRGPWAKESRQPLESLKGKWKHSSSELPDENRALPTLDFAYTRFCWTCDLQNYRMVWYYLKLLRLWEFCYRACMCAQSLSHVWLFATLWTVAHQAFLPMWLSRQDYQSVLPFPPLRVQPELPSLLHWQVDPLPLSHLETNTLTVLFLLSAPLDFNESILLSLISLSYLERFFFNFLFCIRV